MKSALLPMPHRRGHIESLNGIRGIAVLLVLAAHFQVMAVLPPEPAILRLIASVTSGGWCGVDLFFVLSGFLITGILLDTKAHENRARVFYIRRILRIFPLYYAVVVLSLAASVFLWRSPSHRLAGPTPLGWGAYLFYLQNWWVPFGDLRHMTFLGPLWSLGVEEQFYLMWPPCIWLTSRKLLTKICSLGILGAFLLRWYLVADGTSLLASVVYMNTFTRMDALLAGAFCSIVVRNAALIICVRKAIPAVVAAVSCGVLILILKGHQTWNDPEVLIYCHLFLAVGFGCLVILAYDLDGSGTLFSRALRSKFLMVFGKYSYGIYVFQGFVLELTLSLFRHCSWWGHSTTNAILVAVGWIGTAFFLAFLSYNLFEKHFLKIKVYIPVEALVRSGADSTTGRQTLV